jgi:hypothetical protein
MATKKNVRSLRAPSKEVWDAAWAVSRAAYKLRAFADENPRADDAASLVEALMIAVLDGMSQQDRTHIIFGGGALGRDDVPEDVYARRIPLQYEVVNPDYRERVAKWFDSLDKQVGSARALLGYPDRNKRLPLAVKWVRATLLRDLSEIPGNNGSRVLAGSRAITGGAEDASLFINVILNGYANDLLDELPVLQRAAKPIGKGAALLVAPEAHSLLLARFRDRVRRQWPNGSSGAVRKRQANALIRAWLNELGMPQLKANGLARKKVARSALRGA